MNFEILDQSGADVTALKDSRLKNSLQFEREKTALKYYLLGKGYHLAIKALGFIERVEFRVPPEQRYRKDGITPSLHHQVRIALSVTQLPGLDEYTEHHAIVCALLHDVQEDYDISHSEIKEEFGKTIAAIIWKLTKKFAGSHKNKEEYIRDISQDEIAAIVKGLDRNNNLSTMIDVFSIDKMEQYSDEAETVFLPMVKTASKLFPELHQALMVISLEMKMHIGLVRKYIKLARERDVLDTKAIRLGHDVEMLTQDLKDIEEECADRGKGIDELTKKLEAKGGITPDQAKRVYIKINDRLVAQLNSHTRLTVPDVTELLTEISIALGISTFDLANYPSDKLSASPESELVMFPIRTTEKAS